MSNLQAVEQQTLSRLLAAPDLYWEVADLLSPDHFHDVIWKAIWNGLAGCLKEGAYNPALVDANSGYEGDEDILIRIKAMEADGRKLTVDISQLIEPLLNRRDKELIFETFQKGHKALQGDTRATELAEGAIEALQEIAGRSQTVSVVSLGEAAKALYENTANAQESGGVAMSTGLHSVDDLIGGGLVPGELTVIGAEGASGKTALAFQIAKHIASEYGPVDFQSKEMGNQQLATRPVSAISGVSAGTMRRGGLSAEELEKIYLAQQDCEHIPLYIDDTPKTTIEQLHIRAKANISRYGSVALIVDSVKGMRVKDARLDQNVPARCGYVISELKELAKALTIPVIALAHEVRGDREPLQRLTRKELYGGSNMEDCADNILILFRPEPILIRKVPKEGTADYAKWEGDLMDWRDRAQIHADKVRMGSGGRCAELVFHGPTSSFKEDRSHQEGILL